MRSVKISLSQFQSVSVSVLVVVQKLFRKSKGEAQKA